MSGSTGKKDQGRMAFAWALLGTLLFTLIYSSGKFMDGEVSALQIIWLRYVSGFSIVAIVSVRRSGSLRQPYSKKRATHFARALNGSIGGVLFIQAAMLVPLADATALGLSDTMIAVVLSIVLLKEKVVFVGWIGIGLCFLGALVITHSTAEFSSFTHGHVLALIGAAMIGLENILIKILTRSESIDAIMFYTNKYSLLIITVLVLPGWVAMTNGQIIFALALGPVAIIAQFCWVRAYQLADASIVTPIGYSWLIFSVLIGFFFFDEIPSAPTVYGSVLIVAGGLLLTRVGNCNAR